jgi:pyruvate dehydrogenase E1 component alpha subunit
VPPDELMAAIRAGRSISLCFPERRILCSAIVGGTLPIAVGIAMGIKRSRERIEQEMTLLCDTGLPRVWNFVGDMTARTGAFHEAREYAIGHALPITFVVENNWKSVLTDTDDVWGDCGDNWEPYGEWDTIELDRRFHIRSCSEVKTITYFYDLTWPHSGAGVRVEF